MNAPVQIRTAEAVLTPPPALPLALPLALPPTPPAALEGLTKIEQRVYAALARANGAFVTCIDLTTEIDGTFEARRMRNMTRYVGNVRIALRGEVGCSIVSSGTNADLRYALIATAQPADETARRQRTVLTTVSPDGDQTIMGRIAEALIAAGGRYLTVVDLCQLIGTKVNARNIANVRSRVNEVRSTLRVKGITASILSQGGGESLSYAWSDTIETAAAPAAAPAEVDPDAPRPTMRITLPPIGGRTCIYDGDSLVLDGVKQPRVARQS